MMLEGVTRKEISFLFVDNVQIRSLNKKYFRKDASTDVIAFFLDDDFAHDILGEIIISVEETFRNSESCGVTFEHELLTNVVHGILHLAGYRDCSLSSRKKMQKRTIHILKVCAFPRH